MKQYGTMKFRGVPLDSMTILSPAELVEWPFDPEFSDHEYTYKFPARASNGSMLDVTITTRGALRYPSNADTWDAITSVSIDRADQPETPSLIPVKPRVDLVGVLSGLYGETAYNGQRVVLLQDVGIADHWNTPGLLARSALGVLTSENRIVRVYWEIYRDEWEEQDDELDEYAAHYMKYV
jgi:hypothetical protein